MKTNKEIKINVLNLAFKYIESYYDNDEMEIYEEFKEELKWIEKQLKKIKKLWKI